MKLVVIGLTAFAVTACAAPRTYNRIDAAARSELGSVDSVLMVKQSEIQSSINESNITAAGGGGLLLAVIDAGVNANRTSTAEERIAPVRDKLIEYDFATQLEVDLERELASTGIESIADIDLVRAEEADYRQNLLSSTDADAVMFLDSSLEMSENFDTITLKSTAFMYPKSPDLYPYKERVDADEKMVEPTDNIFRHNFATTVGLGLRGKAKENATQVANMSSEDLIAKIKEASTIHAREITAELMIDDEAPSAP